MKLIDELGSYLGDLIGRARSARRLGEVVEVEVAAEITTEAAAASRAFAQTAFDARVDDDEADNILTQVLADGVIAPAEIPLLRHAQNLIRRSAAADHRLAESF